jgi:peptidoglycan/xylan/chitin deacetylase (PgdA/CDA1 family)/tetratricopeptide (TPR) repeat protein
MDFFASVVHDLHNWIFEARSAMKSRLIRIAEICVLLLCIAHSLAGAQTPADAGLAKQADAIVDHYRKIIVLMDGAATLDPGVQERASTAGKILFQQNQERLSALEDQLVAPMARANMALAEEFLTRLESNPEYRDADKLAFRDTLENLAAAVGTSNDKLATRLLQEQGALAQIQTLYQKEIGEILGNLKARGMVVHREAWEHYVASLRRKYTREQILKDIEGQLPPAESRGAGKKKASSLEVFGNDLPPKTLVLTFDDGPHPRYTDQILEILKKYGLKAVFFEVGRNLGPETTDSAPKLAATAAVSERILAQGSTIGNHSYSHPVLSKMPEAGYTREIETTNALLTAILKQPPVLFRPPYGATNDAIIAKVEDDKMKSILWNVDSEDWADPVPNSIAQRVVQEVEKLGHGIILFHDIHKVTLEVLPTVIETLEKDGFRFTSWNGTSFGPEGTRGLDAAQMPAPAVAAYRDSWAAVVGIDDYQTWPKLSYASNDAQAVRDLLVKKYNFNADHVFLLLDKQATRQNILSLLGDKLANPDLVKREDRVFVFFAGHGATRHLASGRDLGYIIPVDADLSNYEGQAISMTNFQDVAEAIPAKHLFFVMDSCYSGLALTRGGGTIALGNYLLEISRRTARQMFTAGGADQQVADNGPNGHSVFTWTLLQALDGRADLNGDGVITATELAAYVTPAVSALSHQTPSFGNLPGGEGGDFIFELNHETEFLNENSAQLGEDAIKVNSELEKLKDEIHKQAAQNEELKKQLAAAEAQLQQEKQNPQTGGAKPSSGTTAAEAATKDLPAATNDEGMRFYKEKKYAEALAKFKEASELQPSSALFANNAGFACFKLGQYEAAVQWFQKTIAADPNRAIAYLNLGDAYLELGKKPEAKQAFEKFLALQPNSRAAPGVMEKLKNLQ